MKKFLVLFGATIAMATSACNNVEVGLIIEEVPPPEFDEQDNSCSFTTGTIEFRLVYDSANMTSMWARTEVTNVLSDAQIEIVEDNPNLIETFSNTASPVRFDFRWECDSNGFTAGQGPLILPAFSIDNPFCLDTRDETSASFAGFDQVSATGASVAPNETQIWAFEAFPPRLGDEFNRVFRLAELSDQCCRDAGGCQNVPNAVNQGACPDLQVALDSVAPGAYSLQQPETVRIWEPFALYTSQGTLARNQTRIPSFPLRIRGLYEAITASGNIITSTEFVRTIGVCKGDGPNGLLGACTGAATIACLQTL